MMTPLPLTSFTDQRTLGLVFIVFLFLTIMVLLVALTIAVRQQKRYNGNALPDLFVENGTAQAEAPDPEKETSVFKLEDFTFDPEGDAEAEGFLQELNSLEGKPDKTERLGRIRLKK